MCVSVYILCICLKAYVICLNGMCVCMNGIVPTVSCAGTDDNICCMCKDFTLLAAETCREVEAAIFTSH